MRFVAECALCEYNGRVFVYLESRTRLYFFLLFISELKVERGGRGCAEINNCSLIVRRRICVLNRD